MGIAAGTKEGMLADFSSRGIPRDERLSDDDPLNDNALRRWPRPEPAATFAAAWLAMDSRPTSSPFALSTNLTSNGLTADTEIAPGMLPFYTQISGTSMATPFVAGVVALMLDADPTLTPDEIRQILTETTTRMPGYQEYEVGAGYVNAYAAVDKVFNRAKAYSNFSEADF